MGTWSDWELAFSQECILGAVIEGIILRGEYSKTCERELN